MKLVIQRVENASCTVEAQLISEINNGFLILVGIKNTDTVDVLPKMVKKVKGLRVFEDENKKMNLDINSVNGDVLSISQFTLFADCKHGNRPSFINSMTANDAKIIYDKFCEMLDLEINGVVKKGIFGANMSIKLINDGPVTIILDSEEL